MAPIGGLILIAVGIIGCFFGWRIFKIILALAGFLLGMSLGTLIAQDATAQLIIGVVAGVIVAGLSFAVYRVVLFLAGGLLGALLAFSLSLLLGWSSGDPAQWIALVIGVVVGALLALALAKLIIIAATAYAGAVSIVAGAALIQPDLVLLNPDTVTNVRDAQFTVVGIVAVVALWLVGALFQYRDSRDWRGRSEL